MNRCRAFFDSNRLLLVAMLLQVIVGGCAPQTSSDGKQTIRNKNAETVGENGGEVGIDDGSKVVIPAGAVAAGTQVSVQKVADDPAFSVGVASASSTVELKAVGPDGVAIEVAVQPMTIALAIDGTASLNLADFDLNGSSDSMCVLLKTSSGKQMIWRRTLLTIDTSGKKVTFQSLYFGKYKAVYCGTEPVSGFEDAAESGATGAAQIKLGMTVPKDFAPDISQGKYCLALVRGADKNCDESVNDGCKEVSILTIATSEAVRAAGSDNTISLSINESSLAGDFEYYVGLGMQNANEACGPVTGKSIDETGPGSVKAFYIFKVGSDQVKAGLSGTLGVDDVFKLEPIKIKIGGEGAFANLPAHDEESVCIDIDGEYGKTLRHVSFAAGKIDGQVTLSMLAASPAGNVFDRATIRIGESCKRFENSFDGVNLATGKPYEMTKSVNADETVLLTPIKLRLTRTNTMPDIKSGCLRIYQPNGGNNGDPLGEMMLSFDQPNYDIYVPYVTSGTSSIPKYDFEITALKQGTCRNSHESENQVIQPLRQDGKDLNATIDVSLPF